MQAVNALGKFWKRHTLPTVAVTAMVGVLWSASPSVTAAAPTAAAPAPASVQSPLVTGLPDFTVLVDQVGPSVVNIRTLERVNLDDEDENDPNNQMLELFRRFGLPVPPGAMPQQAPRQNRGGGGQVERPTGVGSGFVLSSDGYIMTNAHVVDGADEMIVTLTDKREFKAKVVGTDKRTDVAVLKISASGLKPVRIGDVGKLRVGEWVMAIGSPFGLESTVTAGIVSAKQRDTGDYLPFIQTDVAINPGNSGGPLINMRGEVVGINSQIYSRSGGFQGISFAIPIDEAVRVSDQLRSKGKVTRGRIGVSIDGVPPDLAESLGLAKAEGALVRAVEAGSPAAKAGIEPGDIIVKFDDKPIVKAGDLPRVVGNTVPGAKSKVTVWRRGGLKELALTVAQVDGDNVAKAEAPAKSAQASTQVLGLTVRELTAEERQQLGVGGVVVVNAQGPAARVGLRESDVVLQIGNLQLAGVKDFEKAVATLPKDKAVPLLIRRGDWVQYVPIRPSVH
ncbi:MAG TPA: Do family serine endopeptidase [Macromonas sp.]|nr:Do family serine endopeptidase [Macromonas sp.]